MANYTIPVSSGILKDGHKQRIGPAIWEFLWCIDKTTQEVKVAGEYQGLVLGGKPVSAQEIADSLKSHPETVKRNLRRLVSEGYLLISRSPYGYTIKVNKSKKWRPLGIRMRESENALSRQSNNALSRESENALSPHKNALSLKNERQSENALSEGAKPLENKEFLCAQRQSENALSSGTLLDNTVDNTNRHNNTYVPQTTYPPDQGQGSLSPKSGEKGSVNKSKLLRNSFIQDHTIDQAFSLFGELEPAVRGFIDGARKARERGILENFALGILYTFKSLYDQDKDLFSLALARVMGREDFDYGKRNLTGLVEWYFKNPETIKKEGKSGNFTGHPARGTGKECHPERSRRAAKETGKAPNDDPYGDIPTRDIPYGDPRLDNVEDPYEDISTRDIPL